MPSPSTSLLSPISPHPGQHHAIAASQVQSSRIHEERSRVADGSTRAWSAGRAWPDQIRWEVQGMAGALQKASEGDKPKGNKIGRASCREGGEKSRGERRIE